MLEWINETCSRIFVGALMPFYDFFADTNARYYWVFCITGLAMAAFVHFRRKEDKPFFSVLFDREVWTSRSAINDYIILMLMPVLRITIFAWAAVNWQHLRDFTVSALTTLGVSGSVNDGTAVTLGILMTLTLFVVDDFLRWYTHYLCHRIPEFWEYHKVHHSAEVLNFATAERIHPVEAVATTIVLTTAYGIINGLFIGFFGDKLTVSTVAGANIFMFAFNLAGGALRHSPFYVSFGPAIERWIISPAMHQIHHSDKPEHFDRNMGGSLAVWDRMFGTLYIPKGREIEGFGIGEETRDFRSLEVILFRPFTASFELLRKRFARAAGDASAKPPVATTAEL